MAIKLPNGKIARTIAEQVYKNMQDILFLMNKKDFQILVVEELPEEGSENTLYLVPSDDPEQDNVYTEYIWTGTAFEMVGTTAIDISNMVTTDTNQNIIGEKTFESQVTFYDEIVLSVDAAITGDVLPKVTNNDNIGSATHGWRDYYVEGTLYLKNGDGYSSRLWKINNSQWGTIDIMTSNDNGANWGNRFSLQTGAFCPTVAGVVDLGCDNVNQRWKDLHLSGSINGSGSANLDIKNSTTTLRVQPNGFVASDYFIPITNNGGDLGVSGVIWRNLYIGGTITDGTRTYFNFASGYNKVTQNMYFAGSDAIPQGNCQLGTASNVWNYLYVNNLSNGSGDMTSHCNLNPSANNALDLGNSSNKWKDLYLAGVLSDGTNSVNVADLKALIDYAKAQGWIS